MDYEEFWRRLNLPSISKFLLYGDDSNYLKLDNKPLQIRLEEYYNDYISELEKLEISDEDELIEKIIVGIGNSEDAYFELGLIAGFVITRELLK